MFPMPYSNTFNTNLIIYNKYIQLSNIISKNIENINKLEIEDINLELEKTDLIKKLALLKESLKNKKDHTPATFTLMLSNLSDILDILKRDTEELLENATYYQSRYFNSMRQSTYTDLLNKIKKNNAIFNERIQFIVEL